MRSSLDQESWQQMLPDTYIKNKFQNISHRFRLAFFSALIFGFITHIFMFVNKLPNGDDLESMYRNYSMITSGRWFDKVAMALSSYYSMPWVTGVVALFFLALSIAMIVSILDIKKPSNVVMTGALLTTFPILAAMFSYMFYADLYMISMFLSVSAIWLTKRYWYGLFLGALGIACSMGCYQAYIGFAIVLCILSILQMILNNEKSTKEVIFITFRYLCVGILGVILYFVVSKFCLSYFNLTLTDYQGIDQMGNTSVIHFLNIIPEAYVDFFAFFFSDLYLKNPVYVKFLYAVIFLLISVFSIIAIVRNQVYKKITIVLVPVLLGILPLAFQVILFMAPKAFLHFLMYPQYALFFVMPLFLGEAAFVRKKKTLIQWRADIFCSWIILIVSCVISYNFYLTSNISYLNLHLKYEITYATELRILDRIEQHPEYTKDTPILFVGAFPNNNHSIYPQATNNFVSGLVGINGNLVHHDLNYEGFYSNYLGVQVNLATEDQRDSVLNKLKELDMPIWPEIGSVDMVDGIMVVNINPS
ncbi:Glucosyl transferase GtrII [Desulfonispora thiosulfatigenes DSM 11270]|uniref:Glucosyl transferase GtrII n=1 Tax=Desulfonispora thiosulfatigenes DSM 11270 TaxID=656914 RepID=A0A1W1UIN2_DESTI|nr:glucosyltransferase domain-containing protein [Desulfonispora thiosulfatigenes]SMB80889.1 Glucosyl transferase GtrII [Desulfonispora thiosulfatigenes DSM 11270]